MRTSIYPGAMLSDSSSPPGDLEVAVDIRVETQVCGFSLAEYARSSAKSTFWWPLRGFRFRICLPLNNQRLHLRGSLAQRCRPPPRLGYRCDISSDGRLLPSRLVKRD